MEVFIYKTKKPPESPIVSLTLTIPGLKKNLVLTFKNIIHSTEKGNYSFSITWVVIKITFIPFMNFDGSWK